FTIPSETPCAEPHAGCCGGWGLETPGYPIDAYNTVRDQLETLQAGSLGTDSTLRRTMQGFKDILNQAATVDGADAYLFEIGITRDKFGALSLDSSELANALADDFNRVSQILADETTGYATVFSAYADQLLDLGGVIDARDESLDSQMRTLQGRIDRQKLHLVNYEKILVNQFMSLDQTMSILQSTSNYLTGQLATLSTG
ncbi:MAG: flagellar filament capping protein FliD, partial [Candidatus Thiodiazotropha sp. (ex Ustalcina ferruginea)]|nr:flagellar filament capping protein FliD [Candidatus Thiodiazotropha sp. (ex Ustalcina ferruginea)]